MIETTVRARRMKITPIPRGHAFDVTLDVHIKNFRLPGKSMTAAQLIRIIEHANRDMDLIELIENALNFSIKTGLKIS